MKSLISALALALACSAAYADSQFVKQIVFPEGASPDQKIEMAARLVPTEKQHQWQALEMTAFLHFGVNTFTDREWGDGTESPEIFNPVDLDADQWVKTLKDAGFGLVILTAKHHDGFCLWPTKTTGHSVAASPWRNGKGDVMADLRKACDKYGMKLGVYLSPWDRNAECYGNSPEYNDMFVAQLTELLTNYGRIDEVWFDGACGEGPNGKKQEYDWMRYKSVIEKLQPHAVMAVSGDDVRWVGNEKGVGRETEWSATALTPGIYPEAGRNNRQAGVNGKSPDQGSQSVVAKANALYWWPSEVDVSIRPGWFYHDYEQPKSLRHLVDIYLKSVGRNSVLLLNIPPDRRGLIADADVARLAEFKQWIDANFSHNLASDPQNLEVDIEPGKSVNTVVLGEDISKGQHVEAFTVEGLVDGSWQPLCHGTTIGNKRIITFHDAKPEKLRLKIDSCRGRANIDLFEAYSIALPMELNAELPGYRQLSPTEWSVVSASGSIGEAYKTFDDTDKSFWTSFEASGEKHITIDMKRTYPIAAFAYCLRGDGKLDGTPMHYRLEVSTDGRNWTELQAPGEFSNIVNNPIEQRVYFPEAVDARYFRFTALDEIEGRDYITIGDIKLFKPEETLQPKDDETALWPNPSRRMKAGVSHPRFENWKFLTSCEFNEPAGTVGVPKGWRLHRGKHVGRNALIDSTCFVSHGTYLRMNSHILPDSVDNGFGVPVKYTTYACRTAPVGAPDEWCNFTENMRIEVRMRRTPTFGINDALWFMGNNNRPWPANGEIDLLENPKDTPNNTAHFTLHSENHYAGTVGGSGSVTANIDVKDMSDWNIYWIEWLPEKIIGGVNGATYFVHDKGADGNTDWPWSDPQGFYMLMTSGLSTNPAAWPGAVAPTQWDRFNPPHMDIDWIRVFTK